jgi:UDP-N-acetylmuramate dehydrogenase
LSVLNFCVKEGLPVWLLGGGSNVLIPDEGLRGITIQTRGMNGVMWEEKGDSVLLEVEAGVTLAALLSLSIERGWSRLEFVAGIPGSVGGALRGNAGVEGRALGDLVESVLLINNEGLLQWEKRGDLRFSYRFSDLLEKNKAIVACRLLLAKEDTGVVAHTAGKYFDKRAGQPKGVRTAGCLFKNPEAGFAGKILDDAGCKGLRQGDAEVSRIHANFIVNTGSAGSKDILRLISLCRERVYQETGILLELELCVMGEFPHGEVCG